MLRQILMPHDGSPASDWVFRRSKSLLKSPGASVTLIWIKEASPGISARDMLPRISIRKPLSSDRERLGQPRFFSSSMAAGDEAGDRIVEEIGRSGHDLVILATHTHIASDVTFFGSVARRLLQRSPAPILFFRPLLRPAGSLSPAADVAPARFSNILVPLGSGRLSEAAFDLAKELERALGSIVHPFTMDQATNRDPLEDILRMADQGTIDLVCVASQDRRRLIDPRYDRMVARLITHPRIPVLVVPEPAWSRAELPKDRSVGEESNYSGRTLSTAGLPR